MAVVVNNHQVDVLLQHRLQAVVSWQLRTLLLALQHALLPSPSVRA